jgi:hypothetical protein
LGTRKNKYLVLKAYQGENFEVLGNSLRLEISNPRKYLFHRRPPNVSNWKKQEHIQTSTTITKKKDIYEYR